MKDKYYVIKDCQTNTIYIDTDGFMRMFEILLDSGLTLDEAKAKYPEGKETL